jgi:2-deoxy-D-gluconate 3-dehydrogenase
VIGPDAFSLAGRAALVTGGASGIGAAIARALAAFGADVGVTVHERGGDDVLADIRRAGRRGEAFRADLGRFDETAAAALVEEVAGRFGHLDILVNNAGIIRRADALDHPYADWRAVMAVDLDAVFLLAQAAARRMAIGKHGRIINVASVLAFEGGIRVPGYAAAKHAVVGLTRALANEWAAHGITVNAIAPGYVATDNTAALQRDESRMRELLARIPVGRFGEPDEIAGAAIFLASPAAGYVTGSTLVVDGGWLSR